MPRDGKKGRRHRQNRFGRVKNEFHLICTHCERMR